MLYFSKLRIISISLTCLFFLVIAFNNIFNLDKKFFDKKINLGLDLQGGSYLLLEIDNTPVIEQKLQNTLSLIKNFFKNKFRSELVNVITENKFDLTWYDFGSRDYMWASNTIDSANKAIKILNLI